MSAQTGWRSAIDIGVASLRAQHAGEDCCEAMRQRKLDFYGAHLQALQDSGIQYVSAVYSTYGREHPATTRVLRRSRGELRGNTAFATTAISRARRGRTLAWHWRDAMPA